MKIFLSNKYNLNTPTILTIGIFDGVHKGHQNIIYFVKQISKYKKLPSCLLTFEPHPKFIINKSKKINLLTPLSEKINKLHFLNLHVLIIQKFNIIFSKLSSEDFIQKILVKKFNINTLIIGYDHQFGNNREGNFMKLNELSKKFKFQIIQIPAIKNKKNIISSTKIRQALLEGNLDLANEFLGYYYNISGKVIHGSKIGKLMGFPTANLNVSDQKLIPKKGVYFVKIWIYNISFFGIMNIGNRPTFQGKKNQIEVHIFNFSQNIYGKTLYIELINYIRKEIEFNSSKELIKQIIKDKLYIIEKKLNYKNYNIIKY